MLGSDTGVLGSLGQSVVSLACECLKGIKCSQFYELVCVCVCVLFYSFSYWLSKFIASVETLWYC